MNEYKMANPTATTASEISSALNTDPKIASDPLVQQATANLANAVNESAGMEVVPVNGNENGNENETVIGGSRRRHRTRRRRRQSRRRQSRRQKQSRRRR